MERRVLVTGASSGIGAAVCRGLLAAGCHVVGVARDFSKFRGGSEDFAPVAIDLSDLDGLPGRLAALVDEHGQIDALVLSAGRGRFGGLEEFSYGDIRDLIDLNFTASAYVVRAFLPRLRSRGGGDIVVVGSEAALQGRRRGAVYCASKFALRGFAQALREEAASAGVRVSMVHPGPVRTPFFDDLSFEPGGADDNAIEPGDIARVVEDILRMREGTVVDEVWLSPRRRVLRFRRGEGSGPRRRGSARSPGGDGPPG